MILTLCCLEISCWDCLAERVEQDWSFEIAWKREPEGQVGGASPSQSRQERKSELRADLGKAKGRSG